MSELIINGGIRLNGKATVHGAKNSALPILAATLAVDGVSVIHNCPDLSDVRASLKILSSLGCKCSRNGSTVTVDAQNICGCEISESLMREMRSSIIFLGAVASRSGMAKLTAPGGCEIGPRPIDLHLSAMRELGAEIDISDGCINCDCNRLKGSKIVLPIPSVGATENIMIAAATAVGTTQVVNAAKEPEIRDLADFLNAAGADISGAGEGDIIINGVKCLHSAEHTVIPDRILTATYMSAVAITGGDALVCDIRREHIEAICAEYKKLGCRLRFSGNDLRITAPNRLSRLKTVRTHYYPGFPTDAGPMLAATTTVARGTSVFVENVFENRFKFADELNRLGADIKVEGRTAVVDGVEQLYGARVKCTDLRGGAALMVAAFAAKGETVIDDIYHIERGYENAEQGFASLGADIKRR